MKFSVILCLTLCFGFALSDGVVICYWNAESNARTGLGRFGVDDLPTELCTHIVYSFLYISAEGGLIQTAETEVEGESNRLSDFAKLKEQNSDLVLMAAVGGWTAGSDNFTIVVNNETLRSTFVSNVLTFLEDNCLGGIDLDWEYPAQRGGADSDKEAFVYLLEELKAALEPEGKIVTVAVGVTQSNIDLSYYVANISETVDYINLMTYDLHGTWDGVTGANAPLYAQLTDAAGSTLNVASLINIWIDNGAAASKLVVGLAAYGKSFTLASLDDVSTGAATTGAGAAGNYTVSAGTLAYYEICLDQLENEWNVTQVNDSYVYGNSGLLWVGYDNPSTIKAKAAYAKNLGLAGIMFWATDLDDFSGACDSSVTFPLIRSGIEGFSGTTTSSS